MFHLFGAVLNIYTRNNTSTAKSAAMQTGLLFIDIPACKHCPQSFLQIWFSGRAWILRGMSLEKVRHPASCKTSNEEKANQGVTKQTCIFNSDYTLNKMKIHSTVKLRKSRLINEQVRFSYLAVPSTIYETWREINSTAGCIKVSLWE